MDQLPNDHHLYKRGSLAATPLFSNPYPRPVSRPRKPEESPPIHRRDGLLTDGRPFLAEAWSEEGYTGVIYLLSSRNLAKADVLPLLENSGEPRTTPELRARPSEPWVAIDGAGQPMWGCSFYLGHSDEVYIGASDAWTTGTAPDARITRSGWRPGRILLIAILASVFGGFLGAKLGDGPASPIAGSLSAAFVVISAAFMSALKSTPWIPRPFYQNKTKDDFHEWFSHVYPWSGLDQRIHSALINRLYGSPMFEVFIKASQDLGLVWEYAKLTPILDQAGASVVLSAMAGKLLEAGAACGHKVFRMVSERRFTDSKLQTLYLQGVAASESAILLEPDLVPAYVELAMVKQLFGRKDETAIICKAGLEAFERIRATPFEYSALGSVKSARPELEQFAQMLRGILAECSREATA